MRTVIAVLLLQCYVSVAGATGALCSRVFSTEPSRPTGVKKMDSLKVAAVQFPLGEKRTEAQFFEKVSSFIDEAQRNGAQMVVFPELVTTEMVDWKGADGPQLQRIAAEFTPRYIQWLQLQAQRRGISILGGTTPRVVDGKIFNVAILALSDGKVVLQDKLFLTPDEKQWAWSPGTQLQVFEAPWGKTAITTCFDCEFPIVSQMLAKARPDVILVPSWTSSEAGLNRVDWTAKARAVEHYAFVVKTGTVPNGTSDQPHFGKAAIVTPQEPGFAVHPVEGKLNEASIVYGNLDLKLLRERRDKAGFYPVGEQRDRTAPLDLVEE